MIENKSWFILVKVDTGKKFKIKLPIPIYVCTELFYSLEGLTLLADLALPRLMTSKAYEEVFGSGFGFYNTLQTITDLFEALQESGA
ncbi:MAG TPA: hypothetical protein DDZ89_11725, partial [Clostridiales bacterium]|nr:hypothetical protein [Clostridiales bacterium]